MLSGKEYLFGINYLLPIDNILANLLQKKTTINDNKVKFLLMGRFCYSSRDLEPIAFLEKLKLDLNKEYEITIMGSHAKDLMPFFKKNNFCYHKKFYGKVAKKIIFNLLP